MDGSEHTPAPGQTRRVERLAQPFDVEMDLPGSKSITLRDAVLATLADGRSEIRAPGECDDFWRMEHALGELGIHVERAGAKQVFIEGGGGTFREGRRKLDVGMSAASTRFLMAMVSLRPDATDIDGHPSMRKRPNGLLLKALADLGVETDAVDGSFLPARLHGPISGREVSLDGSVSSQYFSALLMVAPLLPNGLDLRVEGELVSQPYIDITLSEMAKFGVTVEHDDYRRFRVAPQRYSATNLTVEGDASAASYFMALATIHGSRIALNNLGTDTPQGDYAFAEICERLGARVERSPGRTVVTGPKDGVLTPLQGEIDMELMPDVAPTLIAIAPLIGEHTVLTGLATLRVKECDRIAVPAANLKKLGVPVIEGPDFIEVGSLPSSATPTEASIETHDDHRMAMSFAVLGSRTGGLRVRDPSCVNKTYPGFWDDLDSLYR